MIESSSSASSMVKHTFSFSLFHSLSQFSLFHSLSQFLLSSSSSMVNSGSLSLDISPGLSLSVLGLSRSLSQFSPSVLAIGSLPQFLLLITVKKHWRFKQHHHHHHRCPWLTLAVSSQSLSWVSLSVLSRVSLSVLSQFSLKVLSRVVLSQVTRFSLQSLTRFSLESCRSKPYRW